MSKMPDFKPNFKYTNMGNVIGSLCYAKELKRQDGTVYGYEFLINAHGSSVNVRVPNLEKGQRALDNFPLGQTPKPKVRVGMATISSFFAQSGKVYTNVTSFAEMQEAVKTDGTPMAEGMKGRIGGEIASMQNNSDGTLSVLLVIYDTKDGERIQKRNGEFLPPKVLKVNLVDTELINQFTKQAGVGANVEFGYEYINKENKTYDEFGFPVGDGKRMERIEAKKLVVHHNPNQQNNFGFVQQQPQQQPPQADPFSDMANPFGGVEINDDMLPF